ncbi:MAG: toll/interleukin-1 receptor domain-containing protein, partial [Anaerolineae bacterium]|nr:toll/interleukin-1 receptor domain-containing protein [Anaerolineae bacterium]
MPRIFISYSHKDRTVAKRLVDSLRSAYGYNEVWFDENLSAGQVWRDELLTQIVQSDIFLFLISPDSIQSDYCKKELAHAQGARKPIIPLMVRSTPINALPHELEQSQILDVVSGISTPRFASLQNAIQLAVQKSAPPTPPQTTPDINISGDYMPMGSISGSGIGKQVIDKQINNYTNIPRIIIFIILLLIGLVALFVVLNRPQAAPPDPTVAYEFLVDTSDRMLESLNGVPRYEIVNQAIRQIADSPGLNTNRTYRAVRFAGGGDLCSQTELMARGAGDQSSLDEFLLPLSYIPSGTNAVEAGIRATFEDLAAPQVQGSDVKVVFIMLGALDLSPCRDFNIPIALSSYKQLGIATTFCTFTLLEDLPGFERFQREMLDQGFGCVNNVDDPQEISKIALTIIDQLIKEAKGEEVELTPFGSPTAVIFLRPTDTPTTTLTSTPSPQPTATDTVTTAPTDTDTPTTQPTDTDTPTTQPTDTDTPTTQPTDTPLPTDTATNTPSSTPTDRPTNTPTPEPTDTATKTPTRRPSPTPSNTPTRTPSPTPTTNLRATQTRVAQVQQTN